VCGASSFEEISYRSRFEDNPGPGLREIRSRFEEMQEQVRGGLQEIASVCAGICE